MTLSFDCGGGGIKASVLDEQGTIYYPPLRVPTPYPLPPSRLIETLRDLADRLPAAERITVGIPGMIRHGVVIATPHYVTRSGPRSPVVRELLDVWNGYDAQTALSEAFQRPVLVLNDAEVHGAELVSGVGLELVLTLGTGLGCAVFDRGMLAPHIELSHAPIRRTKTYDTYIGEKERRWHGNRRWSRRVRRVVTDLRPVFRWDRLYLGGGNARLLDPREVELMGPDVETAANTAGIAGGAKAWRLTRL